MILVFTGNGKGKTTAAFGHAIRALGQRKRVLIIQFIKSSEWETGEDKFLGRLQATGYGLRIIKMGRGFVGILGDKLPLKEHQKAAQEGLKLAEKAIKSKKHDLIILDEINNAVDLKLIKSADVLRILKSVRVSQRLSPRRLAIADVVLTGRNAPKSFIKIADIATEMKELKHIFKKDKNATKKGVEY